MLVNSIGFKTMSNMSLLFDLSLDTNKKHIFNWFYIGHPYYANNSLNQGCRLKYGLSWNKMLTVGGALCSLWKISLGDLKNISSKFASVTNVCLSEPLSSWINPADEETLVLSKIMTWCQKVIWQYFSQYQSSIIACLVTHTLALLNFVQIFVFVKVVTWICQIDTWISLREVCQ